MRDCGGVCPKSLMRRLRKHQLVKWGIFNPLVGSGLRVKFLITTYEQYFLSHLGSLGYGLSQWIADSAQGLSYMVPRAVCVTPVGGIVELVLF